MPEPEKAAAAENRIHGMINQEWDINPTERAKWETDPLHHPLKDTWVQSMDDIKPEDVNVNLVCWKDCYERNRIRKLECDEVRRRVTRKLKDLGCPTTLIANDEPSPCGDPTAAPAPVAAAPQQQYGPGGQGGYYYYPQGGY